MLNISSIKSLNLTYLQSVTSTMDVAAQLAQNPQTPDMSCVFAEEQTAGRGRQGKRWQTVPYHSLACTYIIRENTGPHLPLVTALAIHRACKSHGIPTQIKWPNDILLNNQKLAGILVEMAGPKTALIGMGLNVTQPATLPDDFIGIFATSANPQILRETLFDAITACLSNALALYGNQGWAPFAAEYAENCATLGKQVEWQKSPDHKILGTAVGLTPAGALELQDEQGTVHLIHSGDVIAQGRTHPATPSQN